MRRRVSRAEGREHVGEADEFDVGVRGVHVDLNFVFL